ncbi:hypothetical protein ACVJ5M_009280 [Bradyrhizobium sp. S3.7.6]
MGGWVACAICDTISLSNGCLNIPGNNSYSGLTDFIGGVQAGYNFPAGHLLFGVEEFGGAGFGHPALASTGSAR